VHFATHGFYNSTRPELSGLVLSLVDRNGEDERGFLTTADVFRLNLGAELVVLSGQLWSRAQRRGRLATASNVVTHSFAPSSDLCDQQHNCQVGGEARCSRTFDGA
jgi:hypothetical protein